MGQADAGNADLVVKGRVGGVARGYRYVGGGLFESDRESEGTISEVALGGGAGPGAAAALRSTPNPAGAGGAEIAFTLGEPALVTLRVLDVEGRRVATLLERSRQHGGVSLRWDGRDAAGREVPSGVYLLCLEAGAWAATRRIAVVRCPGSFAVSRSVASSRSRRLRGRGRAVTIARGPRPVRPTAQRRSPPMPSPRTKSKAKSAPPKPSAAAKPVPARPAAPAPAPAAPAKAEKPETLILRALKTAYWMEVETTINYLANSIDLDGVRAEEIKKSLATDITVEIGHAQALGKRIKELGGRVDGSAALVPAQRTLQPPRRSTDVVSVIRGVIDAETAAIRQYNETIRLCEGIDYVSQDLCIRLLADEEAHRQEFRGFLKEYERKS